MVLKDVCIFGAILNNISRFAAAHTNVQMAVAHFVASSFTFVKSFLVFTKETDRAGVVGAVGKISAF